MPLVRSNNANEEMTMVEVTADKETTAQVLTRQLEDSRRELRSLRSRRSLYEERQWGFAKGTIATMQEYWRNDPQLSVLLREYTDQNRLNIKKVLGSYDEDEAELLQRCHRLEQEYEDQQLKARREELSVSESNRNGEVTQFSRADKGAEQ
jgi:hypothetical protein